MKNVDTSQMDAYIKRLEDAQKKTDEFYDYALRQLAADFLGKVITETPVRENDPKRHIRGGRLVRGWCAMEGPGKPPTKREQEEYVKTLSTAGNQITIVNTVYYGIYVNNGHVTPDHWHWVEGQFFVEHAQDQVHPQRLLDGALKRWLKKL